MSKSFTLPPLQDAFANSGVALFGPSSAASSSSVGKNSSSSKSGSQSNVTIPSVSRDYAYVRPADWFASDPSYSAANTASMNASGRQRRGQQANGYDGIPGYEGADNEGAFSLVDKTGSTAVRPAGAGLRSGAGGSGNGPSLGGSNARARDGRGGSTRGGAAGGRGGYGQTGRGGAAGADASRRGYYGGRGRGGTHILGRGAYRGGFGRYGEHPRRSRNATVNIRSDWQILEEIEFSRLGKLRLEVDTQDPDDLAQYGFLNEYDKTYDRVNAKSSIPLQQIDKVHYNPTTSDDPIIQEFAGKNRARVFATDNILSLLMCATRSVYPWDIVIVKEGDKIFFDKRETEEGPFDSVSVNENAADPPIESERPKDVREQDFKDINSPSALSLEATYVNNTFSWQVVKDDGDSTARIDFANPNPFYSSDEVNPPASCGYRYRKFDLSINENEDIDIIVRTEVDSFIRGTPSATSTVSTSDANRADGTETTYITIKSLFEFDSRAHGSGGAPDWRSKLDSQRGAVVATEMKNNSLKLARFAVQSILAGAEQMKMGYISRNTPKDDNRHVILGTQWYKARDFALQMNVNLANGWGIVRTIVDLINKQPEGKFCLIRDPNSPVIRLYRIPFDAFEPVEEEDIDDVPSEVESDKDGFVIA